MLAVVGGHVDAVSLLLEREATVDMADHQGMTALHLGVSFLISAVFKSRICKDFYLILVLIKMPIKCKTQNLQFKMYTNI